MSAQIVRTPPRQLTRLGLEALPAVIAGTGENASRRFVEFFTANIKYRNTRMAYMRALGCSSPGARGGG